MVWSETEEGRGPVLIFTPDCGNVFSRNSPALLWSKEKEVQVIEGSALVVLV